MSDWITAVDNPSDPESLRAVRLFAVVTSWMEADVIAATIRSAMTQGCERVYLVDNDSPDDTVAVAEAEGAILGRSFRSEHHVEQDLRRHMNELVEEVSAREPDANLWWLHIDADEFPHGPRGLTLAEYVRGLDRRFRVVGMRFFDHYPSSEPHFVPGRHPLDYQPLCEELAYPMCPSLHRKHSLLRHDKNGQPIRCGPGMHVAESSEPLFEPTVPAFLHHFPYRQEAATRRRLEALWSQDERGVSRAEVSVDTTHMLARFRSLDAVYASSWELVENFVARDEINSVVQAPAHGVRPRPWPEWVSAQDQEVARWYSPAGAWDYGKLEKFRYGDDTTYAKGIAFLDGHGTIEDWGCGFAHARSFVTRSEYLGVDGSSTVADRLVDLREYRSDVDCIFMRHVLEHNLEWRRILRNAVASFRKRMVLVVFTPMGEITHTMTSSTGPTWRPVPDISFRREDLVECFARWRFSEEVLATNTQYGAETIFYIEK